MLICKRLNVGNLQKVKKENLLRVSVVSHFSHVSFERERLLEKLQLDWKLSASLQLCSHVIGKVSYGPSDTLV